MRESGRNARDSEFKLSNEFTCRCNPEETTEEITEFTQMLLEKISYLLPPDSIPPQLSITGVILYITNTLFDISEFPESDTDSEFVAVHILYILEKTLNAGQLHVILTLFVHIPGIDVLIESLYIDDHIIQTITSSVQSCSSSAMILTLTHALQLMARASLDEQSVYRILECPTVWFSSVVATSPGLHEQEIQITHEMVRLAGSIADFYVPESSIETYPQISSAIFRVLRSAMEILDPTQYAIFPSLREFFKFEEAARLFDEAVAQYIIAGILNESVSSDAIALMRQIIQLDKENADILIAAGALPAIMTVSPWILSGTDQKKATRCVKAITCLLNYTCERVDANLFCLIIDVSQRFDFKTREVTAVCLASIIHRQIEDGFVHERLPEIVELICEICLAANMHTVYVICETVESLLINEGEDDTHGLRALLIEFEFQSVIETRFATVQDDLASSILQKLCDSI